MASGTFFELSDLLRRSRGFRVARALASVNILEIIHTADVLPMFQPRRQIELMRAMFMRLSSGLENSEYLTVMISFMPILIFISVSLKMICRGRRGGISNVTSIDCSEVIYPGRC